MSDPLSQVLALLRPRTTISVGLDLGGDWSIRFPRHEGIKFNAVMRGGSWIKLAGQEDWQWLETGDCFLLAHGLPFQLASDPDLPSVDAAAIYRNTNSSVIPVNGGGEMLLIGGRFSFDAADGSSLFSPLPPLMVVRRASMHAQVLHWSLQQLADEMDRNHPGGTLVSDHLAHIMLVHLLRICLAEKQTGTTGWLRALGDRRLSRALQAIHADPPRFWTLMELAQEAGMSRTSFAQTFKQLMGQTPMNYLTAWRMLLARDRLRHSKATISEIATGIGYTSEAAFSTAFKRETGMSPRDTRNR